MILTADDVLFIQLLAKSVDRISRQRTNCTSTTTVPDDIAIEVIVDNIELQRAYENPFLGVIIDHNLSK